MKLRILFLLFVVSIVPNGFAQSEFNKTVRDSEKFRAVAEKLGLAPGSTHTIITTYLIEADGSLSNITAVAAYPELEAEAIRIIGTLSNHKPPRTTGGAYVPHKITLPITYRVETLQQKHLRLRKESRSNKKN